MNRIYWTVVVVLVGLVTSSQSFGQAYCALRDPVRSIYRLFPEADSHTSIVREVSAEAREKVALKLPFTLHSTELGTHTIYVVLREGEAEGLVHVRSERSEWGLVEVAWAIDSELRIRGFEIQRCRSRHKATVETGLFADALVGSSSADLQALIGPDGKIRYEALAVPAEAKPLAAALVRNGLKTLEVTPVVWGADLTKHGIGTGPPPDPIPASNGE